MRHSVFTRSAISGALLALAVSAASAQEKRPMTIVELIDVPSVGSPRLSPDGSELLYTRSDTDWRRTAGPPTSTGSRPTGAAMSG